jgi:hypothetical protein
LVAISFFYPIQNVCVLGRPPAPFPHSRTCERGFRREAGIIALTQKKKVFSVPVQCCFSFDQANPGGVILPHQGAMICVGLLLLLLCVQTSPTLSFIVIAQSGVTPVGSGKVLKEARPFFPPLSIAEARRGREAAVCIFMQVYPAKLCPSDMVQLTHKPSCGHDLRRRQGSFHCGLRPHFPGGLPRPAQGRLRSYLLLSVGCCLMRGFVGARMLTVCITQKLGSNLGNISSATMDALKVSWILVGCRDGLHAREFRRGLGSWFRVHPLHCLCHDG